MIGFVRAVLVCLLRYCAVFVLSFVAFAQGVMAGAVTVLGNFTGQVGKKRQVRTSPGLHPFFFFDGVGPARAVQF
jgi:hypothetical protein